MQRRSYRFAQHQAPARTLGFDECAFARLKAACACNAGTAEVDRDCFESEWVSIQRHEGFFERVLSSRGDRAYDKRLGGRCRGSAGPVHSSHITILAESILRTADAGERDSSVLERIALMELQIAQRR